MKRLAILIMSAALLASALGGCGGDSGTAEYTRRDVQNLVEKACDYAKANGKEKALKEFMNPGGPFVKGELYIYAYDFNGTVLSHGGDPTLVGKNLIGYKDPNGVPAVQVASDLARTKGSGWFTCMFPNPLTRKQQDKQVFVTSRRDLTAGPAHF
jgi:cytochrome c